MCVSEGCLGLPELALPTYTGELEIPDQISPTAGKYSSPHALIETILQCKPTDFQSPPAGLSQSNSLWGDTAPQYFTLDIAPMFGLPPFSLPLPLSP